MSLLLAIETATPLCSVALGQDGVVLALRETATAELAHAEKLNLFIAEVLAEAGVDMNELNAVAVGTGPGSYTGLRIGLSAAKGLCYGLNIPIIGIGTLHILVSAARTRPQPDQVTWWPMIDARRMEVYTQPFSHNGSALADVTPWIIGTDRMGPDGPSVVFGDGADKASAVWAQDPNVIHLAGIRPSAAYMVPIAQHRYVAGKFDDLAYLVPEYGKEANVSGKAGSVSGGMHQ